MIQRFRDQRTANVWNGERNARTGQLPPEVLNIAPRKLDMLNAAATLDDMRAPPGNRLEALKGDLEGLHSLRVNDQWRITFRWSEGNAYDVSVTDYHS